MWTYNAGRVILERLEHDADLHFAIKEVFQNAGIRMGIFSAIGAVKKAAIGFYVQEERRFMTRYINQPAEIVSCTGNVSEADGDILVHAHIVLAYEDGLTVGGHLMEGTKIFAGELSGVELMGTQLTRLYDDVTGLKLWKP
jgi:uncharacterized protein